MTEQEKQAVLDTEHLRLLRIGYLVAAGADALFALFPLIYVVIGIFMAAGMPEPTRPGQPSPALFGLFFVIFGLVISLFLGAQAALKFFTARAIERRGSRTLCMVTGGLSCLQLPWGALLGISTFMLLSRPSVKELFEPTTSHAATPPPARLVSGLFEDEETVHRAKSGVTVD